MDYIQKEIWLSRRFPSNFAFVSDRATQVHCESPAIARRGGPSGSFADFDLIPLLLIRAKDTGDRDATIKDWTNYLAEVGFESTHIEQDDANTPLAPRVAADAWLRSKGGWNHDLVHTPSQTVQEICQDDIQRVYEHFIAHGTNQVSTEAQENRAEFVRALNALSKASFSEKDDEGVESDAFKSVVYRVDAEFRSYRHFGGRFQKAIASPHREPAIESERRLNNLVNLAVKEAERAWARGEDDALSR